MVNEWVKVELYGANNDGDVRRFTIADATQVSKGTLMTLTDNRTATVAVASHIPQVYAGVSSESKDANDGATSIGCWTNGIFEAIASGAIPVGAPITGGANNDVQNVAALLVASGANILGYALETASDNEVINVRLRL